MTQEEIKAKAEDVAKRIRIHDAARKLLEAEQMGLRHICEHPNKKEWDHYDYGGGCDHHKHCPDCGHHEVR